MPRTVKVYSRWVFEFKKYLEKHYAINLEDASFEEIKAFHSAEIKNRYAVITETHVLQGLRFFYNNFLNREFNFDKIKPKRTFRRETPLFFTESEILELISKCDTTKKRLLISIGYGCGLDLVEIRNLKIIDIDFQVEKIKIIQGTKKARTVVLPQLIITELKKFIEEEKQVKYLFEGRGGNMISERSAQKLYIDAFKLTEIDKELSFRNLKPSYVVHLMNKGFNLHSLLEQVNLKSEYTFHAYSKITKRSESIKASPLDLINNLDIVVNLDTTKLIALTNKLKNQDEKDFVVESVGCIKNGFLKAGIIMAWNAAVRNIQNKLLKFNNTDLNAAIQKFAPNSKKVAGVDDFAYVKENVVLKTGQEVGLFDKNEHGILEECLNLRNKCGHPGKYKPTEYKTGGFIEDIINIVLSKQ